MWEPMNPAPPVTTYFVLILPGSPYSASKIFLCKRLKVSLYTKDFREADRSPFSEYF